MKNRSRAGLIGLILCVATNTEAQRNTVPTPDKPFTFAAFDAQTLCSSDDLLSFFNKNTNDTISLSVLNGRLTGTIADKLERDGLTRINIRLTNYPRAIFNLSRRKAQNTHLLQGRIVDPRSGDALELTNINGAYYLVRKLQKHFMIE